MCERAKCERTQQLANSLKSHLKWWWILVLKWVSCSQKWQTNILTYGNQIKSQWLQTKTKQKKEKNTTTTTSCQTTHHIFSLRFAFSVHPWVCNSWFRLNTFDRRVKVCSFVNFKRISKETPIHTRVNPFRCTMYLNCVPRHRLYAS